MAETLHVSEGHIVDESGNRIATLSELSEAERFTALEERVTALEAGAREAPAELGTGGVEVLAPPSTEIRQILVGDEVGTPEG